MLKSELIERLSEKMTDLSVSHVAEHVTLLIDTMAAAINKKGRIEVRGFGSFTVNHHAPRKAHNPKTGQYIIAPSKLRPHFKPGKELRDRVNNYSVSAVK